MEWGRTEERFHACLATPLALNYPQAPQELLIFHPTALSQYLEVFFSFFSGIVSQDPLPQDSFLSCNARNYPYFGLFTRLLTI